MIHHIHHNHHHHHYRTTLYVSAVFAVARCLSVRPSVCLSVTLVYCIQTAEDIVRLLSRPGSPIILVFGPQRRYPTPRGTPSAGAQNTRGWGKFAIFYRNRHLSRKRSEIGQQLLWNINRKSSVADRSVSVPMTLSDPNPGFKVTVYLQVEYLKKRHVLREKLL